MSNITNSRPNNILFSKYYQTVLMFLTVYFQHQSPAIKINYFILKLPLLYINSLLNFIHPIYTNILFDLPPTSPYPALPHPTTEPQPHPPQTGTFLHQL